MAVEGFYLVIVEVYLGNVFEFGVVRRIFIYFVVFFGFVFF